MNKSYFFDEPKSHTSLSNIFYFAFGDVWDLVMEDHGGEKTNNAKLKKQRLAQRIETPWLWVKWWYEDTLHWWYDGWSSCWFQCQHVSSLSTFLWYFDSTRYPNIQNLVPSLCHGWLGKSLDGGFSSKVCLICQISQVNSWPKCVKWSFRNMVHKKSSGSSRPFCFSKIAIVGSTPLLGKPISMIP